MKNKTRRLLAVLSGLCLLAAACGGEATTTSPAQTTTPSTTTEGSAMTDDMVDHSDAAEDGDMDHDDDLIEIPSGMAVPGVALEIFDDAKSGHNVHVNLTNFELAPQHASTEPIDGQGHMHLYIDGEKVMRFYNDWIHVDGLEAGEHNLVVELSANNHAAYAENGEAIRAMSTITVAAKDTVHTHGDETVAVAAAEAPDLALEVITDPKSGWNLKLDVANLILAPEHASTDHVPGEGHMHLYVDGVKQGRLYGTWWHLPALSEGTHEVAVEASANNHRAYAVDGVPIRAVATIVVSAEQGTATSQDQDGMDHDGNEHDDSMTDGGMDNADHVISVTIAGGEVSGVTDRIAVAVGSTVAITARSDVADDIHIHGFNEFLELTPGSETTLTFTANAPGLFEVELEKAGTFLFELEVGP